MDGERDGIDAVVVAHPDDETLWTGGTILARPSWRWFVAAICRAGDPDRAPKFRRALEVLGAEGVLGDLDDGPDQRPLPEEEVREAVLRLLPERSWDRVITHSPEGEYTRHRRHEEVGRAVLGLWIEGRIRAREAWIFAYEDGGRRYLPRPIREVEVYHELSEEIWRRKRALITETYGFPEGGFEAETTPRGEAFRRFATTGDAERWLQGCEVRA